MKHGHLKICGIIILLIVIAAVLPVTAFADNAYGNLRYSVDANGNATIKGLKNDVSELEIPSMIGPYPVTAIGYGAFQNNTTLTKVTIPEGVESISATAFFFCTSLTEITIPKTVTSIGEDAFQSCYSLSKVNVGDIAAWCGISFASDSSNPISESMNKDILYVGGELIHDLVIPEGVTSIGNYAFAYCEELTSVTFPSTLESIGDESFSYCRDLTSVTLPEGVSEIGQQAFQYCSKISSVTLPSTLKSIKTHAFYSCAGLKDIYFGGADSDWNNVKKEDDWNSNNHADQKVTYLFTFEAYGNDVKITGYNGPGVVVSIPKKIGGKNVTKIDNEAFLFADITGVIIPDGVETINHNAFDSCIYLTSVTIPEGVSIISPKAFLTDLKLKSVTIPKSVTDISDEAFSGCISLTDIYYLGTQSEWNAIDFGKNWDYNLPTGYKVHFAYSYSVYSGYAIIDKYDGPGGDVVIPSTLGGHQVFSISQNAFKDNTSITSVTVSSGIDEIGKYAFEGCTNLTTVTIPASVYSIGRDAFKDCVNLNRVNISSAEAWFNLHLKDDENPAKVSGSEYVLYYNGKYIREVEPNEDWISSLNDLKDALKEGGVYKLMDDIVCTETLRVPEGIKLRIDLNGHIIDRGLTEPTKDGSVFIIENGTLTITDSNPTAQHKTPVTYVDPISGLTVTVNGGIITGGNSTEYGGIYLMSGLLDMRGGTIVGNVAGCSTDEGLGGGVYVEDGEFYMINGSIVGNKAAGGTSSVSYGKGGAVYVSNGGFTMLGGTIRDNAAGDKGGAIYVAKNGLFDMRYGTVAFNSAPTGLNLYNNGGDVPDFATVIFHSNYTGGTDAEQLIPLDVNTVVANGVLKRDGYTFLSWNQNSDGSSYIGWTFDHATISVHTAHVLSHHFYAQWKVNTYTVKFVDYDGEELQSGGFDYDTVPVYAGENPTRVTAEGVEYTFVGWSPAISKVKGETTYTALYGIATAEKCAECGATLYVDPDEITATYHTLYCYNANCTEFCKLASEAEHSGGTAMCKHKAVCSVCGVEYGEFDPENHEWDDGTVITPASCTEDGEMKYVCKLDETHTSTVPINATGHLWDDGVVTVEPTCTEEGEMLYTCKYDKSHTRTEVIPAKGHIEGEPVIENVAEPRCTLGGSYDLVVYCTVCGEELSRTDVRVKELGHAYGEWTVTKPATCTEDGVETRVCQNNANHKETRAIPATGHVFGDWEVTTEPTENSTGIETRVCSVCGEEETRELPKLDHKHNMIHYPAVAPTETEEGNTEYYICSACGKWYEDAEGKKEIKNHA
ncbi:MAG: leucine-rich repeat protein, partial [Clostridia bacterium]|nr:leucine-rich repeat protein [Clostridia bacterium]